MRWGEGQYCRKTEKTVKSVCEQYFFSPIAVNVNVLAYGLRCNLSIMRCEVNGIGIGKIGMVSKYKADHINRLRIRPCQDKWIYRRSRIPC